MGKRHKEPEPVESVMSEQEELGGPEIENESKELAPEEPPAESIADAPEITDDDVSPELEDETVRRLEEELDTARDRYLRLAAEFDNFRKRTAREQADARSRAQGDVVRQLLEALDDLGRVAGLEESDATVHDVVMGVHLVERKLQQELEVLGTERVGAEGDVFDPNYHEAVGAMAAPADREPGTIAQVLQPGYRLGSTLLRPARVMVYVAPEPEDEDEPPAGA